MRTPRVQAPSGDSLTSAHSGLFHIARIQGYSFCALPIPPASRDTSAARCSSFCAGVVMPDGAHCTLQVFFRSLPPSVHAATLLRPSTLLPVSSDTAQTTCSRQVSPSCHRAMIRRFGADSACRSFPTCDALRKTPLHFSQPKVSRLRAAPGPALRRTLLCKGFHDVWAATVFNI